MPESVRILLTCVGGLGVPKLVEYLRRIRDLDLTIVGVDANPNAVGASFVDEFHRVPFATAPEYSEALLDVCRKGEVGLIVPLSDEEALRLSKDRDVFAEHHYSVLCSPYEATRTASNKYTFLCRLQDRGLPTPKFYRPSSRAQMDAALRELEYPAKKVVFKPLHGHGSRGFRLIDPNFDEWDHILSSKKETLLSLPRLLSLLDRREEYPPFLLMEYLEGETYSVEVLMQDGRPKYIIPQRKLAPRHGSLEVGVVERNADVERVVPPILGAFDFRYLVNIDMSYQGHPRQGAVLPYDLNARPSAVVSATAAAGCFLLEEAIFQALGVPRPIKTFGGVKMMRFWDEKFIAG